MTDPRQTTPPDPLSRISRLDPEGTPHRASSRFTVADASAPPVTEGPGRFVAGYLLEGELGRGGMGVVYRARQLSLNRVVALKMILHADHVGEERQRRFVHEAEALGRLRHPNIVQVHEAGFHEGAAFFSMEYIDGGSLDRQLRGTPLPPRAGAILVETLARAAHHAHLAGLIHRDLQPANVLPASQRSSARHRDKTAESSQNPPPAGESWTPNITDFGLAKETGSEGVTQSGAVVGTPSYMAPKQGCGTRGPGACCGRSQRRPM